MLLQTGQGRFGFPDPYRDDRSVGRFQLYRRAQIYPAPQQKAAP